MSPDSIEQRIAAVLQWLKTSQYDAAIAACHELLQLAPADARVYALLARAHNALGQEREARIAIDSALGLDPDFVPALLEAAQLARAAALHERCVELLEHLLALSFQRPGVHYDLGVSLLALGRFEPAEASLRRALELAPDLLEARFKLAQLALERGELEAALNAYAACCGARPDWYEAWQNRALILFQLGRPQEAAESYARAIQLRPDSVEAWKGYGRALTEGNGNIDLTIAAARRVVELEPESAAAWHRLAVAYRGGEFMAESGQACERALALDPDLLLARWDRFQQPDSLVRDAERDRAYLARWQAGLEYFERLDPAAPEVQAQLSSVPALQSNFYLHYLGEGFVALQCRYAAVIERLAHAQCPPPIPVRARGDGRCRIGFVSGLFRAHIITKIFRSLIEGLPRERFEISLFHLDDRADAVTEEMLGQADHQVRGTRNAREWPSVIAAHPLDALVFVDIGMHPIPQFLMSYRFAPLQCALWGHPVTTGSRHIDWFISADAMEPPEAERNYSERLLRLPRLGACYPYPALAPDLSVAIPARRDPGAVHFLLAQSVVKLTPIHDELLARIAQALPTAQFSLTPHPKEHVRAELAERMRKCFESHGLDFDQRVHIHPWLSEAQFLGLAAQSDVNLDSLGFSGGVTTLEITRFDVPTVTLPGQVMRARQSYGMLKLMGLDELIAQDPDDYVRIAVRLGREPGYRAAVRARIAACKHVLYDDQGVIEAFTRFIESEVARRAS